MGWGVLAEDTTGSPVFRMNFVAAKLEGPPVFVSATAVDTDLDGTIEQVVVTFDETISTYTHDNAAWTFPNNPGNFAVIAGSESGTDVTLTVTADAGTVFASTPTILYTDTGSSTIEDAAADVVTSAGGDIGDGSAPALIRARYQDFDTDGTVDRVTVFFAEPISNYAHDNAAWTFTNNTDLSLAVTSSISAVNGNTFIILAVSATADVIELTSQVEIVYTDTGSSNLEDEAGNLLSGPTTGVDIISGLNIDFDADMTNIQNAIAPDGSGGWSILYRNNNAGGEMLYAHCVDADCTTLEGPVVVDSSINNFSAVPNRIAVTSGGTVVLVYNVTSGGGGTVNVRTCASLDCSSISAAIQIQTGGHNPFGMQMELDSNGNPVVSYWRH